MSSQTFNKDYYDRHCGLDSVRPLSLPWWSIVFYARLCRRLLPRPAGRFLEVGCAHGHVLARISASHERTGFDVSEHAIERARCLAPGARVYVADIAGELPADILRGGFDVVLARYVLEHLPQPGRALARIEGLLAPGGFLLYAVPDTTSPGRRLKQERWFALGDTTHVSLLAPEAWLDLTRAAGLEVRRAFSDGLWDVPYLPRVPRLLQYGIFSLPTIVSVLFAWTFIPAGWGENLIVLAQRPGGPDHRSP